jgi:hypothetical protein
MVATDQPPEIDGAPEATSVHRDVNSDVSEIVVYRQGFHDGADNLPPARIAYAYEPDRAGGSGVKEELARAGGSGVRAGLPRAGR